MEKSLGSWLPPSKAGTGTPGDTDSASASNVTVRLIGSGTVSLRTGSAVAIVVTAFGVGVNTCVRATSVQHTGGWVEKKSRNARMTTTCIGPVCGPTRTLTEFTVPAIGATNVPCWRFAAEPTFIHVHVLKPLGSTVKPGENAGGGPGSTVQSKVT